MMLPNRKATKQLISDLFELILDYNGDEPSYGDPKKRYIELKNEAIKLGWKDGRILDVETDCKDKVVE